MEQLSPYLLCRCNDPAAGASQYLQGLDKRPSTFLSAVLLLTAELARGATSPFHPYLTTLPTEVDCLLAWSSDEVACLQGMQLGLI